MALSADTSPPPAGGDSRQPGENGGPGGTAQPANNAGPGESAQQAGDAASRDSATLPGLPRLFFADEPERRQEQVADRAHGHAAGSAQDTVPGRPGSFGEPSGLGDQPPPGHPDRSGQPPPRQPAEVRRPARRPAAPRPTRQPDRELRQRAIASLVLGMLSLVALLGLGGDRHRFVYLLIFSAVIGVASAVIGVTAVLKARRTGSYRPRGAVGGIVLGALAAMLSIPILALYIAFPRQVDNYITCLNQAQSTSSDKACMDRFYRSIHLGAPVLGSGAEVRLSRTPTGQAVPAAPAGPAAPAARNWAAGLAQGSAEGPPGRLPDGGPSAFLAHLSR
jgi:hypothetical protein